MLTSRIKLINFKKKFKLSKLKERLLSLNSNKNQILLSLGNNYKNNYKKSELEEFKKFTNFRVIGMGGSSLGTKSIYDFLRHKIKKNFLFVDNLQNNKKIDKNKKQKFANIIVSKSGNTIETIVNSNILVKKNDKNIFVTENKNNYLFLLAKKLKSKIVHHNDFIGGRFSVLSEVGMLPAELMGLKINQFKQYNHLIKNKRF